MVAQCGPYVVVYRLMSDASSDFALNNDYHEKASSAGVEAQNQLAQGRNSQEPHTYLPSDSKCFQVAPNSAPSPNIHTFAVRDSWAPLRAMPSRSADLIVMQENLGRDLFTKYPAISSNIQLYTIPCSESRNAMSSASPHREFNSLCSMMRDHVLISGKVNSFA